MTLEEARAIAKAVPNVRFVVSCVNGSWGYSFGKVDIEQLEEMAKRFKVTDKPLPNEDYMMISDADTR